MMLHSVCKNEGGRLKLIGYRELTYPRSKYVYCNSSEGLTIGLNKLVFLL